MGSVINTNTLSLLTQNNLNKSQLSLNTSIQRLSSGLRINSAKDDAAGQAIANRFTANIRGLTQAQRNANDGISLAQTTEGALNEINTNLQRIRELAVQSANGSNSAADKASIQAEITQRLAEINRTSEQTDFNGTKVLAVDKSLSIQVGANDGESISIGLKKIDSDALGLTGFTVQTGIDTTLVAATATPTARVGTAVTVDISAATAPVVDVGPALVGATGSFASGVVTDGTSYFAEYTGGQDTAGASAGNGFYAVTFDGLGNATVDSSATVTAPTAGTTTSVTSMNAEVTLSGADAANVFTYSGTETDAPALVIVDTSGAAPTYFNATVASDGAVTRGTALTTTDPTADPLATLDAALAKVDTLRGSLGAVQNRFDSIISNLGSTITNLSSSRSRIEDADYAVEVSNMTRAQILQQAGTSVLAKANQSTQGVMALLQ